MSSMESAPKNLSPHTERFRYYHNRLSEFWSIADSYCEMMHGCNSPPPPNSFHVLCRDLSGLITLHRCKNVFSIEKIRATLSDPVETTSLLMEEAARRRDTELVMWLTGANIPLLEYNANWDGLKMIYFKISEKGNLLPIMEILLKQNLSVAFARLLPLVKLDDLREPLHLHMRRKLNADIELIVETLFSLERNEKTNDAIALILEFALGMDDWKAVRKILTDKHCMWANEYVGEHRNVIRGKACQPVSLHPNTSPAEFAHLYGETALEKACSLPSEFSIAEFPFRECMFFRFGHNRNSAFFMLMNRYDRHVSRLEYSTRGRDSDYISSVLDRIDIVYNVQQKVLALHDRALVIKIADTTEIPRDIMHLVQTQIAHMDARMEKFFDKELLDKPLSHWMEILRAGAEPSSAKKQKTSETLVATSD